MGDLKYFMSFIDKKLFYKNKISNYLEEFDNLLKKEKYFEAHEVLEEFWKGCKKDSNLQNVAKVLKGFINAAIAFEHLKRNKPKSIKVAKKAFEAYLKYQSLIDKTSFENEFNFSKKEIEKIARKKNLI
jgi:hypothetical protein